jgi:hypothetical protein
MKTEETQRVKTKEEIISRYVDLSYENVRLTNIYLDLLKKNQDEKKRMDSLIFICSQKNLDLNKIVNINKD